MTPFKPVQDHDEVTAWLGKKAVQALLDKLYNDKGVANVYRSCLTNGGLFNDPKQWSRCQAYLRTSSGVPIAIHAKVDELFSLLRAAAAACKWDHQPEFERGKSVISVGLICKILSVRCPCSYPVHKMHMSVMQVDRNGDSILQKARGPKRKVIGSQEFELDIVEIHKKGGRATEVKTHPSVPEVRWYKQLGRYLFVHNYNDWRKDKPCFSGLRQTEGMESQLKKTLRKYKSSLPLKMSFDDFAVVGWDY